MNTDIKIIIAFITFSILIFCYSYLLKEKEFLDMANKSLENLLYFEKLELLKVMK